ncbi:glutamine-hydrolyzing carbamoyl-phosphate synthase small subunit [Candidatus Oscillochloris fontis]|uniref:glutamine-hydrolyzing carbamoyl-phosphate synthase small subunit n=1 Tax=Candidatus Oscillochloris fontis TaxID=2496868 RepID=UPI0015835EDD|nr:glutamine-hydrolyzing carbamoyl-phosphate synthase small subunit [Candidatus Oscillochloris fontis]
MDAVLVLEDGRVFAGRSFGAAGERIGEVVFNTGMTGYQEILTDPSYCGQLVTMTAPHIGNTGVNEFDPESFRPQVAGFIVRSYSEEYSSWRSRGSLAQLLRDYQIVAISDVDTRALTRHIRTAGAMRGIISTTGESVESLIEKARSAPPMEGQDLTRVVSCTTPYEWDENSLPFSPPYSYGIARSTQFHVVAYDFGLKRTILRRLVDHGCRVTVVPGSTSAEEVLALKPDGVFYSNGPGDPAATVYAFENLRGLLGKTVVFGICLGHQLMGLALGGQTFKLPFGHHGVNHPVRHIPTGRVEITSQNHGFAVDPESLPPEVEITHINLNDQTVEGLRHVGMGCFSVQYHPEAGPGPHDASYLFHEFTQMMAARRS